MRAALPALLAAGCMALPLEADPSWLDELQVVGIQVEPPQLGPGVVPAVTVTAADPRERGAEVLVWSCTDLGVGCFEQLLPDGSGRPLGEWAYVGALNGDRVTVAVDAPSLSVPLLAQAEDDDLVMLVWALACAPGVCEVIERVKAAPAPGTEAWSVASRLLAYPDEWLGDLEPGWASLAVKAVPITLAVDNENPTLSATRASIEVTLGRSEAGGTIGVTVLDDDPDDLSLEVYSTFGPVVGDLQGQSARLTWQAPIGAIGRGRIYAVVSDGEGGQAVWSGDVSVLP